MLLKEYIELVGSTSHLCVKVDGKVGSYDFDFDYLETLDGLNEEIFSVLENGQIKSIKNDFGNAEVTIEISFTKEFEPKKFKHTVTYTVVASSKAEEKFLVLEARGDLQDFESMD